MKLVKSVLASVVSVVAGASIALASAKATEHKAHADHEHAPGCGHTAIKHEDHTDYLHDGHLHHAGADKKVVEHKLADAKTKDHVKAAAEAGHKHGPKCGHEAIQHGSHTDYIVDSKLHHVHGDHCDEHGSVN
ncbi:MAG: hypothetical protein RIQ81_2683 [Pseudomonadota bacterium]|jgi:hypothetical protein